MIELKKKTCKICSEYKEEFLFVKSSSKHTRFLDKCLKCLKKHKKPQELDILRKNSLTSKKQDFGSLKG